MAPGKSCLLSVLYGKDYDRQLGSDLICFPSSSNTDKRGKFAFLLLAVGLLGFNLTI